MAKRFTDTDIWDKEWFMILSPKYKCLVRFLFDKCDVAGVWSANWPLASSYIGEAVTKTDLEVLGSQVIEISPGKFFIVDFIEFQYGTLSENCKPHQKIISLLKKYNISTPHNKGIVYPLERVQEKEEDKEEEKEKEKEEGVLGETEIQEEDIFFAKEILKDFGFNEIANMDKLRTITAFLKIKKSSGRVDYFKNQYLQYKNFKNLSGEKKHGFTSFFGDQAERFENGKWDEANWEFKIEEFKKANQPVQKEKGKAEMVLETHAKVEAMWKQRAS